ncbi:MAG: methyltransferase domain-containing protein [Bacteroidetes bacterium]|nr:methyltransferase domain-containing protein [Bacteroidota bacterium]
MYKNHWTDKDVENHWDRVAEIYIRENNKVKSAHNQRFYEGISYLNLVPGTSVINITSRDAGAKEFIETGQNILVTHAEISQGLINIATRLKPSIKQVKIETYSELPFKNETFNRILSLETLEHVSNPFDFLSELHRISTKDARMVLSCPPHTSELPYRIYTFLFGGHGEGPHRFLPSIEVKLLLQKTGWKLILHKGTLLIPVGPLFLQEAGEYIIRKFQNTFISEFGIRQFYVCEKY